MTKIKEIKKLVEQLQTITSDDEYLKFVGFQSEWDNHIVDAINNLYEAINEHDERYYINPMR